jgi:hypothetical protein
MQDCRMKWAKAAKAHLAGPQREQMAVVPYVFPGVGATILDLWQQNRIYFVHLLNFEFEKTTRLVCKQLKKDTNLNFRTSSTTATFQLPTPICLEMIPTLVVNISALRKSRRRTFARPFFSSQID